MLDSGWPVIRLPRGRTESSDERSASTDFTRSRGYGKRPSSHRTHQSLLTTGMAPGFQMTARTFAGRLRARCLADRDTPAGRPTPPREGPRNGPSRHPFDNPMTACILRIRVVTTPCLTSCLAPILTRFRTIGGRDSHAPPVVAASAHNAARCGARPGPGSRIESYPSRDDLADKGSDSMTRCGPSTSTPRGPIRRPRE